jgi:hypothetical protein
MALKFPETVLFIMNEYSFIIKPQPNRLSTKKSPAPAAGGTGSRAGGRPTFAGIGGAASKEMTAAHILDNPPTLQVNLLKKSGGCPLSFKG